MSSEEQEGPAGTKVLDTLYPLTHFIGHRPPTVSSELQPGDAGYRKFHANFHAFVDFGWCDPLRSRLKAREERQAAAQRQEDDKEAGKDNGESYAREPWRVSLGWLLWSRLKGVVLSTIPTFAVLSFIALIARSAFWREYGSPIILGAFGTETVILFCLPHLPAAQPLAIFLGNTISAIISVAIQKAFEHYPSYKPGSVDGVNWAAPVVATITSSAVMQLVGIVHPPGAAIAVLATTTSNVVGEGWELPGHICLISLLFIAMGLVFNNIGGKTYPSSWGLPFWPTAPSPGQIRERWNVKQRESRGRTAGKEGNAAEEGREGSNETVAPR
ncbi:hypothetical protein BCV69DRAFT_144092 [Microstroma glucosiphilum]|uniref:HPP transmembrane region domain-containing protein n=1 Tax=Pseudomicrostroma glucosiphilum TaxID=1684307 RepID=A0A316UB46_9BASI|nr:hypothetical protein BCV69DRAFT_144092 [Pseudomicrostroma glucosiphilum]PWN22446.1 hypothetical protein BCV69DRAFT_144092 [Pseudomicrostroma glucosiphilum]